MTADCGSTILTLISAAEAPKETRTKTQTTIRRNHMHSSFITRKGLVLAVRADLLAQRVRTKCVTGICPPDFSSGDLQPAFPGIAPSDWLPFPRLQLRGSAGFSPASLLINADEDARTKECWER